MEVWGQAPDVYKVDFIAGWNTLELCVLTSCRMYKRFGSKIRRHCIKRNVTAQYPPGSFTG